jgi:hypothetical protein
VAYSAKPHKTVFRCLVDEEFLTEVLGQNTGGSGIVIIPGHVLIKGPFSALTEQWLNPPVEALLCPQFVVDHHVPVFQVMNLRIILIDRVPVDDNFVFRRCLGW